MDKSFLYQNASDVRKNWSYTIDTVVHDKPAFINRTHDYFMMLNEETLRNVLKDFVFHLEISEESDGSLTGFIKELDLVGNASNKDKLLELLVHDMKDYAQDFYSEYSYWSKAPNRAPHIPYILKILISEDEALISDIYVLEDKK